MTGETMKQLVGCTLEFTYMECSRLGGLHAFDCSSFRLLLLLFLINVSRGSSGVYGSCREFLQNSPPISLSC